MFILQFHLRSFWVTNSICTRKWAIELVLDTDTVGEDELKVNSDELEL